MFVYSSSSVKVEYPNALQERGNDLLLVGQVPSFILPPFLSSLRSLPLFTFPFPSHLRPLEVGP